MVLQKVESKGTDIYELTTLQGTSFFIRGNYLRFIKIEDLSEGGEFLNENEEDILNAGFAFAAEKKALSYLERCEQCRSGLTKKLLQKNYDKTAVSEALDYLENRGFLSDERFARSWLSARRITKTEGASRLLSELAARGICKETAQSAVKDFFEEYDEKEIGARALEKFLRQGKSGEKLLAAMLRAGFSYKMTRSLLEKIEISW